MAVPDFQTLMLPVLEQFADGEERPTRQARDQVAAQLQLSTDDVNEILPSGRQTRFANRVAWAHIYLKRAGLLGSPRRGIYQITGRGREVLASPPRRIDIEFLMRYPEFVAFQRPAAEAATSETAGSPSAEIVARGEQPQLTPDEQIRSGYLRLRETVAAQLLERVRTVSPRFFEELVVDLLVAMGYGGSHEDAARVVGRSGDGGIDGIIKEDRLGLESIYVQAKRWQEDRTVGRPDIQQFAGALQGQRARKGVFMTTAGFSRDAIEYAKGLQTTIVLIDGEQLAQLMLDHGVGVNTGEAIKLVKVDEDYFLEE